MWAAFVRQFAAYAITRRGKKLFALIGVLALCFGAALLIDMKFYVSASFTVLLAGFSAVAYVVQHVKLKRAEHQRLLRKAEAARERAIAAQARLERIDTAKSALRGAVTGAGRLVTDNVAIVANEAVLLATETVETVKRSVQAATGAVETATRAALVYAARSWRSPWPDAGAGLQESGAENGCRGAALSPMCPRQDHGGHNGFPHSWP